MKRTLLKLGLFFSLLAALRLILLVPGKSELELRYDWFGEHEYTAVFVGSSRTKCAIIPAEFDSSTGMPGIHSYNFGINRLLPPETFDAAKALIGRKPSLKYVFVELAISKTLDRTFAESYVADLMPRRRRNEDLSHWLNSIAIEMFKPRIPLRDERFPDLNAGPGEVIEPCYQYIPEIPTHDELDAVLENNRMIEGTAYSTQNVQAPAEYLAAAQDLIQHAADRKIKVLFFIPPRVLTKEEADHIIRVYARLPAENRLLFAHEKEMYTIETSSDLLHLNRKGARIFTERLANEFVRMERER